MWLVVGLGNPGSKYARTRHNVGFMVVEKFAAGHGLVFKSKVDYGISDGTVEGERIILLEPFTFMNRSGSVVRKIVEKYNISPDRIVVAHDDLDLETGILKVRKKGSSGGHKGVESVIQGIGSRDFVRVKIGIGRDERIPTEDYVLSRFRKEELPLIGDAVECAADAIRVIIAEGAEKAMNRYNRA